MKKDVGKVSACGRTIRRPKKERTEAAFKVKSTLLINFQLHFSLQYGVNTQQILYTSNCSPR